MNDAHREDRFRRGEGSTDETDSHSLLTRAKVTCALAVLDGRTELNAEDWELAGMIMQQSNETRESVVKALKAAGAEELMKAGKAQGMKNAVAAEVAEDRATRKVAERIQSLRAQGLPETGKGGVKQKLNGTQRKLYDAACELLSASA